MTCSSRLLTQTSVNAVEAKCRGPRFVDSFGELDKCVPTWLKKLTCNPSSAKGSGDARPVMEPDSVVGPEVETMVWIRLCLFATALLHIDRLQ